MTALREIRRIWVEEKHEFCDSLPRIYAEVMRRVSIQRRPEAGPFGPEEWQLLERVCGGNRIFLTSVLLTRYRAALARDTERANIVDELRNTIKRCYFTDEQDAIEFVLQQNSGSSTGL